MKKLTKVLFIAILLTFLPLKQWGQTPYRQYSENGILLDFHKIDNVGFRVFLSYSLNQDSRFILTENEAWGQFSINSNDEDNTVDFYDSFETFFNQAFADFGLLSKTDIDHYLPIWKSCIPSTHFVSIMMDIAMRNGRPSNNHCADSDPFCTSDVIQFEAASTSQTADELESGVFDDGCIGSSYNPSWYHMRINTPGQFVIHMEGRDPSDGTTRDIDFCMWGPFDDPTSPCVAQLTSSKIIDCSYSTSYSEDIFLGYQLEDHDHGGSSLADGTIN